MRLLLALALLCGSGFAQLTAIVTPTSPTPPIPSSTFTPVSPLILKDANGNRWALTMDDFGLLHTTSTSAAFSTVYQLASSSDATSWTLGVTTGGLLMTTKTASFISGLPTTLSFLSTHGHSSLLWNAAGVLTDTVPQ